MLLRREKVHKNVPLSPDGCLFGLQSPLDIPTDALKQPESIRSHSGPATRHILPGRPLRSGRSPAASRAASAAHGPTWLGCQQTARYRGATLRSLEDKKRTSEASCSFSRSSGDIGGQTAVDIVGGADGCEGFAICYWLAACWAHVPR